MIVQAPDGKSIDFGALPPDQVTAQMKKLYPPVAPKAPQDKFMLGGSEPNALERGFLKGGITAGQALDKVGFGQKIGLPSYEEYTGAAKQLKEQGKDKGFMSSVGEFAGNPVALGATILTKNPAVAGAASSVAEPATTKDFAKEKAEQGVQGAISGYAGGKVMKGIAKAVAPQFGKAVSLLRQEGVRLTPGMLAEKAGKGIGKQAEGSLSSVPVLGSFINDARRQGIEDFNKAVFNRVLKPIGEKLEKSVAAGRDAFNYVEDKISQKYDNLLPKLTFKMDSQTVQDLSDLNKQVVSRLQGDDQKQFANLFNQIVGDRVGQGGSIDGSAFKQMQSELNYEIRTYAKSPDPSKRRLGDALQELSGTLKDNLSRMNPSHAKELSNINSAWAAFTRARAASTTRSAAAGKHGEVGVFAPTDLLAEIKKATTQSSFARGDGLLQDLAEAGSQVLPSSVPDSGTTGRALWAAILGGGASAHPAMAGAAGLATIPYSRPGLSAVNALVGSGGRDATRRFLNAGAPAAGAAASQIPWNKLLGLQPVPQEINMPSGR